MGCLLGAPRSLPLAGRKARRRPWRARAHTHTHTHTHTHAPTAPLPLRLGEGRGSAKAARGAALRKTQPAGRVRRREGERARARAPAAEGRAAARENAIGGAWGGKGAQAAGGRSARVRATATAPPVHDLPAVHNDPRHTTRCAWVMAPGAPPTHTSLVPRRERAHPHTPSSAAGRQAGGRHMRGAPPAGAGAPGQGAGALRRGGSNNNNNNNKKKIRPLSPAHHHSAKGRLREEGIPSTACVVNW